MEVRVVHEWGGLSGPEPLLQGFLICDWGGGLDSVNSLLKPAVRRCEDRRARLHAPVIHKARSRLRDAMRLRTQTSLHRVIENEARSSANCREDWSARDGVGTTDRVNMAQDAHLGVSIGDLVEPAGWIEPASGGWRSGRRPASLPCHALHSPLPNASLPGRSGLAPRPGMRAVRSISASMRPSREQPAAAASPEAIHLGGTDVTKSGAPAPKAVAARPSGPPAPTTRADHFPSAPASRCPRRVPQRFRKDGGSGSRSMPAAYARLLSTTFTQ